MKLVYELSRKRCLAALISTILVAVCTCIGVTMNLTTLYDVNFDHMGLRTFCMFTVNSNIVCGLGMLLAVPYAIDGLRKKIFHLPNWMVVVLFAGVTAVSLTFLISLFVLAPVKGFVLIFSGSRFFLHGLCPILAILAFCYFIPSHKVTLKESVFALLPVLVYAVVYYTMVEIVGPDNGGWDDFYGFLTRIPQWISLTAFLPLTFAISVILRLLHNKRYRVMRVKAAKIYEQEFGDTDTRELIASLASEYYVGKSAGNVVIPLWLINTVIQDTGGGMSIAEASSVFLETVMKHVDDDIVPPRSARRFFKQKHG